ncbi:cell envelope integrity protein CreD [Fusobacterium nucleatum subsp. nucleatum ATCC 25586]|uniref:Cell envelope integrity protein CreD n=3 Tax=Fusobacterium nucleatum subsp. nucleatum TaxID=76856 RepID=Q8RHM9_FUSNN|nr:Inner membrane protein [Fusobacterium nucleatum subsp. nucleatum ATCC 25586]ASG27474.1 cell envelope integrity protein CreD [Fusobacterium nucleatum subsp. nucleatum]AVQ15845.1 cell envelope integrity protein CreD [Fusobacterium nucleatum subsp. nucleatum ATCC 25586]AVQ24046.1 cell envelope integrity protein CreD [Fusobacterium nucleatum subsp. nucleatum ATCC 23726]
MKKIAFLFIFVLVLLIPLELIKNLIDDRGRLYNQTITNIGNEWGKSQKIIAPVITISYTDTGINKKDSVNNTKTVAVVPVERKFAILPEELNATIEMKDEVRQRGIYNATVYNANIKLKGYFSSKDFPEDKKVQGCVSIGLTDTKALIKINKFKIGDMEQDLEAMSGTMATPLITNGISGQLGPEHNSIMDKEKIPFEIDIDFRGSRDISILPLGKKNHFEIKSNWKSPSFSGVLPTERTIDENGFLAKWEVSNLIRNYPQIIDVNEDKYSDFYDEYYDYSSENYSTYGNYSNGNTVVKVALFDSVTSYTQIYRACYYGILFIGMSLVVVYIFEVVSKKAAHYVQYGVVGFSLVIFYLLLLSLSEHIGFEWAYLISSLAIVIPNSMYITSMTSNKKFGIGMFIFLSGIYAILFSILRMEQYALLTGSLLILAVLYAVMYLTKKADVFQTLEEKE